MGNSKAGSWQGESIQPVRNPVTSTGKNTDTHGGKGSATNSVSPGKSGKNIQGA